MTSESATLLLPCSHIQDVNQIGYFPSLFFFVITCFCVGGLSGQQPVLGSSDHFSEVYSGGRQVFNLLLHSGQYLHRVGAGPLLTLFFSAVVTALQNKDS